MSEALVPMFIGFGCLTVAWLCVGAVSELPDVPDLERYGWRHRSPLASVLHEERYGVSASVPTA